MLFFLLRRVYSGGSVLSVDFCKHQFISSQAIHLIIIANLWSFCLLQTSALLPSANLTSDNRTAIFAKTTLLAKHPVLTPPSTHPYLPVDCDYLRNSITVMTWEGKMRLFYVRTFMSRASAFVVVAATICMWKVLWRDAALRERWRWWRIFQNCWLLQASGGQGHFYSDYYSSIIKISTKI